MIGSTTLPGGEATTVYAALEVSDRSWIHAVGGSGRHLEDQLPQASAARH